MIYDITLPISEAMVTWPGDPAVSMEKMIAIAQGDVANVTALFLGVHTGTHLDAPYHFVEEGKSIDEMDLTYGLGKCHVIEVFEDIITAKELQNLVPTLCERLLIKTANSHKYPHKCFDTEFVALAPSAAQFIVDRGIKLVGIDYLSIEPFKAEEGNPVHHILLEAGVAVLEGCELSQIKQGPYGLSALPLKIVGADGAPCRAILTDL